MLLPAVVGVDQLGGQGDINTLGYSAQPTAANGVYTVTVTASDGSEQGSWRVDLRTQDLTPQDPVAAEVGGYCPDLA